MTEPCAARSAAAIHQRLGAGDDLEDLLGDGGLAGAVIASVRPSIISSALSLALRIAVMRAPCSLALRLEQRPVDGDLDVGGQQALEDVLGAGS